MPKRLPTDLTFFFRKSEVLNNAYTLQASLTAPVGSRSRGASVEKGECVISFDLVGSRAPRQRRPRCAATHHAHRHDAPRRCHQLLCEHRTIVPAACVRGHRCLRTRRCRRARSRRPPQRRAAPRPAASGPDRAAAAASGASVRQEHAASRIKDDGPSRREPKGEPTLPERQDPDAHRSWSQGHTSPPCHPHRQRAAL